MSGMRQYLAVALGGALGALARYALGNIFLLKIQSNFPYGTFFINVSGSFAIGLFLALVDQIKLEPVWRLTIATGFLGAYTTFSTFEFELLKLLERKFYASALLYVAGSLIVGFLGVYSGSVLVRRVLGSS